MRITENQADQLFTILVEKGNMDGSEGYIAQKRFEFIESITTNGLNEYWFPTKSGSSIKVYFHWFSANPVTFHAQTLSTKDEGIIEAMGEALSTIK